MSRSVRVVLYAVNGSGVGHLTRLTAIARWMRRLALHAGARAEIYFLTSSEADAALFHERFASFKLPSKTAVDDAGIDKLAYLALAKQWVWHSIGLLRPDLFVVDTFPRGSFGELLSALDLCRRRAFIHRSVSDDFAQRADFQAMLPLYDLILVPEEEAQVKSPPPPALRARARFLGPVMARERAELLSREAARARLGLTGERLAVYVTAGGGGDARAAEQLGRAARAIEGLSGASGERAALVIGAGPLYRGPRIFGEHVRWLNEPGAAEILPAVDFAIAAAGYNTYHELLHAGVPAIFWPQRKIADEQAARAARAAEAGAALLLDADCDDEALSRAARHYADPEARARAAEAARALVPRNFARDAAAELLRLVLPAAEVDAAEEAMGDALLAASRELEVPVEPFVELMHALAPRGADRRVEPGAARDLAVELVRRAAALRAPVEALVPMVEGLGRKLQRADAAEIAAAAGRILSALAPFKDWPAAATLLRLLRAERRLDAGALAGEIEALLAALGERGHDLYAGVAWLSGALGLGREGATNQDALRAATARARRDGYNGEELFGGAAQARLAAGGEEGGAP